MTCDSCKYRNDCHIRKKYRESQDLYSEGNIDELRRISNLLELHESYIVEMRRDVNTKLLDLLKKKSKSNLTVDTT
jgi:hypothetical protein